MSRIILTLFAVAAVSGYLLFVAPAGAVMNRTSFKFDFGSSKAAPGWTEVSSTMTFDSERGYGFDLGFPVSAIQRDDSGTLRGDFVTSDKPFFFSVALPEGNYNVTVTLGDAQGESDTTVKSESRRLMLEHVKTAAGNFESRVFTVNIRSSALPGGKRVSLKEREKNCLHWDNKLTLEFSGPKPCVAALEITPVDEAITVFLLGDSTVTDQPQEPWNSWGQMLPRFLKPGVAVANHAESGESLRSSEGARRFEKVFSTLKPGDYVFVQFGHNDQKHKEPEETAMTGYKKRLLRLVADVKLRGGLPVLVTSVQRLTFDDSGRIKNSLGDFPEVVRQVAAEEKLPLIDLHAMSKRLYEAIGPANTPRAAFVDKTHHNAYGSYELAKCVVQGIRQNKLGLAKSIVEDFGAFDPARPDPQEDFKVPASFVGLPSSRSVRWRLSASRSRASITTWHPRSWP